jgi:hypothetical protein
VIPGAWIEVVEGAGHFIWVERPGAVRAALRRLVPDHLDLPLDGEGQGACLSLDRVSQLTR